MSKSEDRIIMFGDEVKAFRQQHGFKTPAELAEVLGLTPQAVIFWERNERFVPEPIRRLFMSWNKWPQLIDYYKAGES